VVTTGLLAGALTMSLTMAAVTSSGASVVGNAPPHCAPGATSSTCTLNVPWDPSNKAYAIFPFNSGANFTEDNISVLQQPLFRPLYWFGLGSSITVQYPLSAGKAPTILNSAGKSVVTMHTRGWTFTNNHGAKEPVDARSIRFFLNIDHAEAHLNYGGYVPHFGIPDQVANVATPNSTTVVLTMDTIVNKNWLLYNFLSEIVPFPLAWDTVGHGVAGCGGLTWAASGTVSNTCTRVWSYLNAQNNNVTTYATNPLWQWVDGPFRLHTFGIASGHADGNDVMVPNTGYNGPVRAKVGRILFHEYVAVSNEVNALKAHALDTGYADPSNVTVAPAPGEAGHNLPGEVPSDYTVQSGGFWGFNYAYYNFGNLHSTDPVGGVAIREINQLYIRQALQDGIDQVGILKRIYRGYGVTTFGPIPSIPKNPESAGLTNPYAFNETTGRNLLKAHNWNTSNTPAVCKTGGCGAGIPAGSHLSLNYLYTQGSTAFDHQISSEKAEWATEGIQMNVSSNTGPAVGGICFGGQAPGYQICQYGGWIYAPDYYPSGELLYATGAISNAGGYTTGEMDSLIRGTTVGNFALNAKQHPYNISYGQYTADQLPVMFQPTALGVDERSNSLHGSQPPNPLLDFNPEYVYK
jgi:peptide/nickel transport system substrate-binding protein